jgi:DNA-binding NtrC family response regulator
MTVLLGRWGCKVLAAESADELIQRAGGRLRELVQVLVVDLQLRGGRSGIDAIAAIKHACGGGCPTLIVSGAAAPERLAQLQSSGFEWLTKPVAAARLRSWLVQAGAAFLGEDKPTASPPTPVGRAALETELRWTS